MKETILYYDCFSGISGDMNLAALIGLGVPEAYLNAELAKLELEGWSLRVNHDAKRGISGLRADIELSGKAARKGDDDTGRRSLSDIKALIEASDLGQRVKATAISIFGSLADAAGRIQGIPASDVLFREVGDVDSIICIVGAALCLEYLKPDIVIASTVELGGGSVAAHGGALPVPTPAVIELLKGAPVKSGALRFEATTQTGAAVLATIVDSYSDDMRFTVQRAAYGVGRHEADLPNVLRVFWAEREAPPKTVSKASYAVRNAALPESRGVVVECNMDDMNPEMHGHVMEALISAGADDVWITPIVMIKSRSAITLSALCSSEAEDAVSAAMLAETTSFGIRRYEARRTGLERSVETVPTSIGNVRVRSAVSGGRIIKRKPEYDDVKALATANGIPLVEAYAIIRKELG